MKIKICLLAALLFATGLYEACAQTMFAPAVTNGVGDNPLALAAADVNGDGKIDIICGNLGDNPFNNGSLSILTNDGTGKFTLASTIEIGEGPGSVVAADVNGDGKLDLITANWNNGNGDTLSVWTNSGNGVFGSNATYTVGAGPSFVTSVDINGDGWPDLICANEETNTITVLTNDGTGAFILSGNYVVGAGLTSIATGDVNRDGYPDLICANYTGNTLTVLTNNGSGILGSNATYTVGTAPVSVAVADLMGNGRPALVCAINGINANGNTLLVLTNNGGGIFGSNADYVVGTGPNSVAVADVNGDGKPDLISGNTIGTGSDGGDVSVLTNNGSDGFVLAATLTTGSFGGHSADFPRVATADLNGDGKADLVCVNAAANTVAVLTNMTVFPRPASMPALRITAQHHAIRLSWPYPAAGWSLQQNPNLTKSSWGPSEYGGYRTTDDGTNNSLTLPTAPGGLYFRLLHP